MVRGQRKRKSLSVAASLASALQRAEKKQRGAGHPIESLWVIDYVLQGVELVDEPERPEVAEGELIPWGSMMICVSGPDESDRDVRATRRRDPEMCDSHAPSPDVNWGLHMFRAPKDVVDVTIQAAEQCYLDNTGFRWGELTKGRPKCRVVYSMGPHVELTRVLLAWFGTLAENQEIGMEARQLFQRDEEILAREIAQSGVGFAPPNTGGVQLHRDDDHGFTLLLATDCISANQGVVVLLPNSQDASWDRDLRVRSHETISEWPYALSSTTSEVPGQCWLFPSSTLHFGRGNCTDDHWRILFNITLGNDTSVNTIR